MLGCKKVVTFWALDINFFLPLQHGPNGWRQSLFTAEMEDRERAVVRMGLCDLLRFTSGTKKTVPISCVGVLVYDSVSAPLRMSLCVSYDSAHKPTCELGGVGFSKRSDDLLQTCAMKHVLVMSFLLTIQGLDSCTCGFKFIQLYACYMKFHHLELCFNWSNMLVNNKTSCKTNCI